MGGTGACVGGTGVDGSDSRTSSVGSGGGVSDGGEDLKKMFPSSSRRTDSRELMNLLGRSMLSL